MDASKHALAKATANELEEYKQWLSKQHFWWPYCSESTHQCHHWTLTRNGSKFSKNGVLLQGKFRKMSGSWKVAQVVSTSWNLVAAGDNQLSPKNYQSSTKKRQLTEKTMEVIKIQGSSHQDWAEYPSFQGVEAKDQGWIINASSTIAVLLLDLLPLWSPIFPMPSAGENTNVAQSKQQKLNKMFPILNKFSLNSKLKSPHHHHNIIPIVPN